MGPEAITRGWVRVRSDAETRTAVLSFHEGGGKLHLRVTREASFELAVLDRGVERIGRAHAERRGIESFLGAIREPEHDATGSDVQRPHRVRGVIHLEIGPVVLVREDVATIVGVAGDPAMQRGCEGGVLYPLSVVPEGSVGIEANGALARGARWRGETIEVGVVTRLHAHQLEAPRRKRLRET